MKSKILIAVIIILIAIQFFTIDKTNPIAEPHNDFIAITNPPTHLATIIKNSCYDCHSHQTQYPWYSNIAPVSWILKSHIDDGRRHLNFSTWSEYDLKKQDHKLVECIEMVKTEEMPMPPYILMHSEAELSEQQRVELVSWFSTLRK